MENSQLPSLISYDDVIKNTKNEKCHLLLGNGFNASLGVCTSYKCIFDEMKKENHGIYKEAETFFENSNNDLEQFIGYLIGGLIDDNNNDALHSFLKKYVGNKVKHDFMIATHKIVRKNIKNIYAEKNEDIYLLLENFENYFTLNYDSFLYLLLLNFKENSSNDIDTLAFEINLNSMKKEKEDKQNNIYGEIETAWETGKITIDAGDTSSTNMKKLSKTHFLKEIEQHSKVKKKGWKRKDIKKVVDIIFDKEKKKKVLKHINDGLFPNAADNPILNSSNYIDTQNLFFLHGAFHIYRKGELVGKITQTTDKALYERISEILDNDDEDIVCVFQSEKKIDEINKNSYLKKCYDKLSTLTNIMVIIGSSLSDNDQHIFDQINASDINTLYIATLEKCYKENYKQANKVFKNKNLVFFRADSITYQSPYVKKPKE